MSNYPVINQSNLRETPKRGLFGLGRRIRESADIPEADASHTYVYRVDGEYVLDPARLSLHDDQVVRAANVSVVDMRSNAPILVDLTIPSKDADNFSVTVTFVCSVLDAIVVVREGIVDASETLESYLKSHTRIFELGLEYALSEVNVVRQSVNAQITAFCTLKPPTIPGLRVKLASVEVATPAELAHQERMLRERRSKHEIETQEHSLTQERRIREEHGDFAFKTLQKQNNYELDAQGLVASHDLALRTADHERAMERQRAHFELQMQAEREKFQLEQAAARSEFNRRELTAMAEIVGQDPRSALGLAHVAGDLTASQYAQQLALERNQDLDRDDARLKLEREDVLLHAQRNREFDLRKLEADLESDRLKHEAAREDARFEREETRHRAVLEREDSLRELLWQRDQQMRRQDIEEKDGVRRAELNLKILHELVQRGHLDLMNLDNIVGQMIPGLTALPTSDPKSIPSNDKPGSTDSGDEIQEEEIDRDS